MFGSLAIAVIAVPEVEIGDDWTRAEDARGWLGRVVEQGGISWDSHDDIGSSCDGPQIQDLLQTSSAKFICIESTRAVTTIGREPVSG